MLSRQVKDTFYKFASPLMRVNGFLYKNFRAPKKGTLKVHLGPGQENYIKGWINIDANMFTAKCDIWADLRNPLPFHSGTVDAFYSHHMIEHLPDIQSHLKEVFRCLKPGGVYRVGGPNCDSAISKFVENDLNWFGDFPEKRASIGGKLENFIFCGGEHLSILTFSMLNEFMQSIGFKEVSSCQPSKETKYVKLFNECLQKEHETDFKNPHTLIIEAKKI